VSDCDPRVFQETALKTKTARRISKALAEVAEITMDPKPV
jgi:hypothetical protein